MQIQQQQIVCSRQLLGTPMSICKLLFDLSFILLLVNRKAHAIGLTAVSHEQQEQQQQGERVMQALKEAGYNQLATALHDPNVRILSSQGATMFAPTDAALSSIILTPPAIVDVLAHQLVCERLTYEDLLRLHLGSMLHTSHPDIELVVTSVSNSTHLFAINGVSIADPGIYSDESLTVHGVESLFHPIGSDMQCSSATPGTPLPTLEVKASLLAWKPSTRRTASKLSCIFARGRSLQRVPTDHESGNPRPKLPLITPHGNSQNHVTSGTGKKSPPALRWLLEKARLV